MTTTTSEQFRTVPLSELRAGDRGHVLAADLCAEDCELLRAMGMAEECPIRVCRTGGMCIVQANATRLGLSRGMTRRIMVSLTCFGT